MSLLASLIQSREHYATSINFGVSLIQLEYVVIHERTCISSIVRISNLYLQTLKSPMSLTTEIIMASMASKLKPSVMATLFPLNTGMSHLAAPYPMSTPRSPNVSVGTETTLPMLVSVAFKLGIPTASLKIGMAPTLTVVADYPSIPTTQTRTTTHTPVISAQD